MKPLAPHPDYSLCTWAAPSHGDRCTCGGVRYWHAVANLGCDDCPCEDFVPADVPSGRAAVTLVPSVEELAAYFQPHGDAAIHVAFGWLTSACTRPGVQYSAADLWQLAVNLREALRLTDFTSDARPSAATTEGALA